MDFFKISKEDWKDISQRAHGAVFKKLNDPEIERIDFVIAGSTDDGEPIGYATCKELSGETVYLQFGGVVDRYKKTVIAFKAYEKMIEFISKDYTRIHTRIGNTNTAMLKMAMKVGFRVIGIRYYGGGIFLEHELENKNAV